VLFDQFADPGNRQAPCFGDAECLKFGVLQTDMRVEAAARSGDSIRWNRLVGRQTVLRAEFSQVLRNAVM
jgi:hypothetical protein